METTKRLLRSRRGDLLMEGMVGAAVVGIIFAATTGALIIAGQISTNNSHNAARHIYLNSQLAEILPTASIIGDKSAPDTLEATVLGKPIDVTTWQEPGADATIVYSRTATQANKTPIKCSEADASPENQKGCLLAAARVDTAVGGISLDTFALKPGPGGAGLKTVEKIPASTAEIRYLFTVAAASTESTVTFTADAPSTPVTVTIPASTKGNFYGSLTMPATATHITITTAGSAEIGDDSFFLYGAPLEK